MIIISVVVITGSAGLIGSEAAEYYTGLGYDVIGIDNNMRQYFFGIDGSTVWNLKRLQSRLGSKYKHYEVDIRDAENLVNANGTLLLLEAMLKHCPEAVFIFTSTNKVYGDRPNQLPLIELDKRWEIDPSHPYNQGIPESMGIDQCLHSLFGTSKLAADLLVQEYGRYFHLKTCCFRGGVLSGAWQSGVPLHGFINYLMKCLLTGSAYTIFGYKGKQVRDVIASDDVISAIHAFYQNPRSGGEVYNLGGGRASHISILEAIELAQEITGKKLTYQYNGNHRKGDHIWYISDLRKFISHYPHWKITKNVRTIMEEIIEKNKGRWTN